MITLDKQCGVSYDLIYLLEEATSMSQFNTVEEFIIDAAVKEAGKVLAKSGDSNITVCDEVSIIGQELQPEEYQLDMFEDEE